MGEGETKDKEACPPQPSFTERDLLLGTPVKGY